MSSPDGPSFPSGLLSGATSPSGNEGFFPFELERRGLFLGGGPEPEEPEDLALQLQRKEKDLVLAAELGKMLLERNEELRQQLEMLSAQHSEREEPMMEELQMVLAASGSEAQAAARGEWALGSQPRGQPSCLASSSASTSPALSSLAGSLSHLPVSAPSHVASLTLALIPPPQRLQQGTGCPRGQYQAQALAWAELRTRESLQGENKMLQSRRQDLEAQIRGLREEAEKGQGWLQVTREELLVLRREQREHSLELEHARFEAREALGALQRLQRRVLELEEESRFQNADVSAASLQSELARTLDSDHDQDTDGRGDALTTLSVEPQEPSSPQALPQESLEPPKKRTTLSPSEMLEKKEAEVARLEDEIALQREEMQSLREELQRQKELREEEDPEEALSSALSDRDEAVNKALELSLELSRISLERDSLSRELLRAIRQKVALTQELEAWQDDMQVVIGQQLRSQRQKELSSAKSPHRASPRFSLRLGPGPAGGFLSNLFRRT
uniref:BICD family-like cargo adapter 2 n=1 Tax=Loxodonta africana TaxID=9785 RepID=G3ULI0_LOXAF